MGISIDVLDFNERFAKLASLPIILNDFPNSSLEQKQLLNSTIYTTYTSDLVNNVAACDCRKTYGEYNIGVVCKRCRTEVRAPHGDLESYVWLRAPEGVRALINPTVWLMLTKYFTKGNSSFCVIRWLADASYTSKEKSPDFMRIVEGYGFKRGINFFYDHFDIIMEALFSLDVFRKQAKQTDSHLEEFLKRYRSCVFSQYIPLPNKMLLVMEENNSGTFIDPVLTGGVDAIRDLIGIDSPLYNYSILKKENRAIHCIDKMSLFYQEYYKKNLAKKEGLYRKHIYGTRSHFSFRSVISSITDPHRYNEIYIPWGVAINVLTPHLTNKLLRNVHDTEGRLVRPAMTPNQITSFLFAHVNRHSPLLEQLFNELIAESPRGGIGCVLTRNPSLKRGSCQQLLITRIKMDPDIPTISLSILAVRSLNADFDGDAVQVALSVDEVMERGMENLAPHKSSLDFDSVRGISDNSAFPKPVVATIANWLSYEN